MGAAPRSIPVMSSRIGLEMRATRLDISTGAHALAAGAGTRAGLTRAAEGSLMDIGDMFRSEWYDGWRGEGRSVCARFCFEARYRVKAEEGEEGGRMFCGAYEVRGL